MRSLENYECGEKETINFDKISYLMVAYNVKMHNCIHAYFDI